MFEVEKIKFLEKTWFIMGKVSPAGHVFLHPVQRRIRLNPIQSED